MGDVLQLLTRRAGINLLIFKNLRMKYPLFHNSAAFSSKNATFLVESYKTRGVNPFLWA